jgi:hypothetical protein
MAGETAKDLRGFYGPGLRLAVAKRSHAMSDIIFLALSVAFFGATVGIAYLFELLREHK